MSGETVNGNNALDAESSPAQNQDVVPRQEYEKLLIEASSYKEKAGVFDELLTDPKFLEFLEKEDDEPKPSKLPVDPSTTAPKGTAGLSPDVKALTVMVEQLATTVKTLEGNYNTDRAVFMRSQAEDTIKAMAKDKENFPFFDEPEVRESMAKLLETGRAANMADAYRLCTYEKAVATGRNQVVQKKGIHVLPTPSKAGASEPPIGKRSLRDIIGSAMDKVGLVNDNDEE